MRRAFESRRGKINSAFTQEFSDRITVEPVAADEMIRGECDEARVFVHLAHHVNCADDAEAARVEEPDFHALVSERHPRINI